MAEPGLWITEDDVASLLSLEDAIDVLAQAYRLKAKGAAASMPRAHLAVGPAILHAVGGAIEGLGVTGTKTWTYTPGGAAPLLTLFSLEDGRILGTIEAFGLGRLRTAATSGLGTRVLARAGSSVLAVLGTGKQSFEQACAIILVRPIEEIRVFGRDKQRRDALVARLREAVSAEVIGFDQPTPATTGADVITTITRSAEPFVTGTMLTAGTHINAVGAIVPSRRELDETAVGRCALIVADDADQAFNDSGELRAAEAAGAIGWDRVKDLGDVIDSELQELRNDDDVTLFKALGAGLSDVALGAELLRRALDANVGEPPPRGASAHAARTHS